jgi:hypothetical protein
MVAQTPFRAGLILLLLVLPGIGWCEEQPPLVATVLGEAVRTDDPTRMHELVLTRLFDRYAQEQGIEVTDAELDALVEDMRRGMRAKGLTAEDRLSPEEAVEADKMRRQMAGPMLRQ